MGPKVSTTEGHKDQFAKMVTNIKKQHTRKVTVNPDKKYLLLMQEEIVKSKLPEKLKYMVAETLSQKVTQEELIQSITCINALRNNQFQTMNFSKIQLYNDKPDSLYVQIRVNFEHILKKLWRYEKNQEDYHEENVTSPLKKTQKSNIKILNEVELKENIKSLKIVLKKEFNRISNPFGKMNKAFAEYIHNHLHEHFVEKDTKSEQYLKKITRLAQDWCLYLESSCLAPYKKWMIVYLATEQAKYRKWINEFLMQEIWAVNNGYLFSMLNLQINKSKIKLDINVKQLEINTAVLTPSLFKIDEKLQIEGHFFDAIYEMSEIEAKVKPEKILQQLQIVKKRLCTDVDNYHRLFEKKEVFEIDSDNILGIVAYILCRIPNKINQIYNHLLFLRIVYGETVFYSKGISSYMLSTIFGAFQFLESTQFRTMLRQKRDSLVLSKVSEEDGKISKIKSETKCNSTQKQNEEKIHTINHQPEAQKLVSSWIVRGTSN